MDKLKAEASLNELKADVCEAWTSQVTAEYDFMLAQFAAYRVKDCDCTIQIFPVGASAPQAAYDAIPALIDQVKERHPGRETICFEQVAIVSHIDTLYGPGDPLTFANPQEDPRYRECLSIVILHEDGWTAAIAPIYREPGQVATLGEWSYDSPFCLEAVEKGGHSDLLRLRLYLEMQGKKPTKKQVWDRAAAFGMTKVR